MKIRSLLLTCVLGPLSVLVHAEELGRAVEVDYAANLEPLFRDLHANPELSHREFATARHLAAQLASLGISHIRSG